jgi:hypothetical protein
MSHLTSTSIPAPVSRAAAPSVSEAPAPAATGTSTVRSGPQPAISRPRHLALVPENTPTSNATALAWIDALTQAIDGCAAQGVEELSVFVCAKTNSGPETLLNEIR